MVSLQDELGSFFPDISFQTLQFELTRGPFNMDVDIVQNSLQEEDTEIKCDSQARKEFPNLTSDDFSLK